MAQPETVERLRRLARDRGVSFAEVVREALDEKALSYRPKPQSIGSGQSGPLYSALCGAHQCADSGGSGDVVHLVRVGVGERLADSPNQVEPHLERLGLERVEIYPDGRTYVRGRLLRMTGPLSERGQRVQTQ